MSGTVTPLRANDERREMLPPLGAERQAIVEQGLLWHQRTAADLEVTRAELDTQRQTNKLLELEIEELRHRVAQADARTAAAEQERDDARLARAELELFFSSVVAQAERFQIQPKPMRARKPAQSET